jgi:hypothetical protein
VLKPRRDLKVTINIKALRFAAASTLAFAAVATVGASSALASTQWVTFHSCTHGGHPGLCAGMLGRETLWESGRRDARRGEFMYLRRRRAW